MSSDSELLLAYAREHSEAAFAEFVRRHIDLVYSAALRRVGGDSHAAADVAQRVFLAVAQRAKSLAHHPALAAWLYTGTRNAAANLHRQNQRRQRAENYLNAMHSLDSTQSTVSPWNDLKDEIDEAIDQLDERDRQAVILRFFAGNSYPEIAAMLRIRQDAARMRVDRALEKLRAVLARRGITSTAAALGGTLAANAVTTAPAGLAATFAHAAVSASISPSLLYFMSGAFLKNLAVVTLLTAGATGLFFQHWEIESLKAENSRLVQKTKPVPVARRADWRKSPPAFGAEWEIERLRAQVAQLKSNAASSWQDRVARLHEVLEQLPEQNIPEITLASDEDWLDATKGKLESTEDYRRALAKLRDLSINKFVGLLQPALMAYCSAHGGQFPSSVSELQGFVKDKIDDAIWSRYVVASADRVGNVQMGGRMIITQGSVVDPTFDSEFVVGPNGRGSSSFGVSEVMAVEKAYKTANGKYADDPQLLFPYATTDRQKAAISAQIERRRAGQLAVQNN